MEESGVFFIKFYLAFQIISGIIKGMDFVHPEGFLVKGIESEGEANEETEEKNKYLFFKRVIHPGDLNPFLPHKKSKPQREMKSISAHKVQGKRLFLERN